MNQTMKGGPGNAGTAQEGKGDEGGRSQKPLRLNTIVPCAEMITRGNTVGG